MLFKIMSAQKLSDAIPKTLIFNKNNYLRSDRNSRYVSVMNKHTSDVFGGLFGIYWILAFCLVDHLASADLPPLPSYLFAYCSSFSSHRGELADKLTEGRWFYSVSACAVTVHTEDFLHHVKVTYREMAYILLSDIYSTQFL